MAEKRQLEFYVLRYAPDAVKEEFINIGVLMVEPGANGNGFADVSFATDWRRLHCLDPQADIEILEAFEREIRRDLGNAENQAALLKRINDSFSNVIQASPIKACHAEQPAEELALLTQLYTQGMQVPSSRSLAGRAQILGTMRNAFEQAGVWRLLMHGVPVAPYTKPGDPMKFDFGYRIGSAIKLFHATSLKNNTEQAITMASRYPAIAAGMNRLTKATPFLTAVVDDLDRNEERIQFALGMMREARITVTPSSEMTQIAEAARQELKV